MPENTIFQEDLQHPGKPVKNEVSHSVKRCCLNVYSVTLPLGAQMTPLN